MKKKSFIYNYFVMDSFLIFILIINIDTVSKNNKIGAK